MLKNKFDGEGEIFAFECILWFLDICIDNDVYNVSVLWKLFFFTFQGFVKSWCKTLSYDSIHSFKQFIDEFITYFQESIFEDLFKEIDKLWMRPNESMDDFSNIFLNIYYKIHEKDKYWYHMIREFPCLVGLSERESKLEMNIDSHKSRYSSIMFPNFTMLTFVFGVSQTKPHISKVEMIPVIFLILIHLQYQMKLTLVLTWKSLIMNQIMRKLCMERGRVALIQKFKWTLFGWSKLKLKIILIDHPFIVMLMKLLFI